MYNDSDTLTLDHDQKALKRANGESLSLSQYEEYITQLKTEQDMQELEFLQSIV